MRRDSLVHQVVEFSDAPVGPVLPQLGQDLTEHVGPGDRKGQRLLEKKNPGSWM